MINLNTPVAFSEDFNKVTSDLLTDNTGQIIATAYHLSNEQKKEFAKRVNKYPELAKLVMDFVDNYDERGLQHDEEKVKALKNAVHNISRKGMYK